VLEQLEQPYKIMQAPLGRPDMTNERVICDSSLKSWAIHVAREVNLLACLKDSPLIRVGGINLG
jgi:hypothetical protein